MVVWTLQNNVHKCRTIDYGSKMFGQKSGKKLVKLFIDIHDTGVLFLILLWIT